MQGQRSAGRLSQLRFEREPGAFGGFGSSQVKRVCLPEFLCKNAVYRSGKV